jgi:hypothetical protein
MKTPATVLNKAADLLEKYGWIQNKYGSLRSGMCGAGAVNFALDGSARSSYGWREDTIALRSKVDGCIISVLPRNNSLVSYNDKKGRTKEQVVKLLRRAAKKCDGS